MLTSQDKSQWVHAALDETEGTTCSKALMTYRKHHVNPTSLSFESKIANGFWERNNYDQG